MQSLDVFLSRLLPQVPGCPDVTAKQALLDSCVEFCEKTHIVQNTSAPQTATAGVGSYTMTLAEPTMQAVVAVTKLWFGTALLVPVALIDVTDALAFAGAAGGETVAEGIPTGYYETAPGVISLYPVPAETQADMITARVATKPLRTATTVDDTLYRDWAEAIVGGAVGRLCELPNTAFSNAGVAALGHAQFLRGVRAATRVARFGRVVPTQRVQPRPFT